MIGLLVLAATTAQAAPKLSGNPPTTVQAGNVYDFTPTVTNDDRTTLTFWASYKPSWATFDDRTGRLRGTPSSTDTGATPPIKISASYSVAGKTRWVALPEFAITVTAPPPPPPPATTTPTTTTQSLTLSGTPPTSVTVGQSYSFTPTVTNPYGTQLTFWASHTPSWATFDKSTGRLAGTPTSADVGTTPDIKISISYVVDGTTRWMSLPLFQITVLAASAPVSEPAPAPTEPTTSTQTLTMSGTPPTAVTVGQLYAFAPTVTNPYNTPITFWASYTPSWATFDKTTGLLTGTPSSTDVGTTPDIKISLSYVVSGTTRWMSLPLFQITVLAAPAPAPAPEPTSSTSSTLSMTGTPPTSVSVGQVYDFVPTVTNPHNTPLTFWASYRPAWATFDQTTGRLRGVPSAADVGTTPEIKLSISYVVDGTTRWMSLPRFTITVLAASSTPSEPEPTAPTEPTATGATTLTWLPPTETVSGNALVNLAGYKLLWGSSPGNYTSNLHVANPGISSWVLDGLAAGTYYFVVVAINGAGEESGYSNMIERVVAP